MTYAVLILGLVVLVLGAELLVRGAVQLASLAKIAPLVIGLTVVAFGTSAPELAVSSVSSYSGEAEIALGNVVGSNIFNVALILGLSATIIPLTVASQLVRLDVPLMIGATAGVWLAALDGAIQVWEGVVMWVVFVIYTGWLIKSGKGEAVEELPDGSDASRSVWSRLAINVGLVLVGLLLLVLGARWLVESSTSIARRFGVSDLVIGLTIVAGGTSLPELATSIVAAVKGQRDIAIGNVVGSNVFNLLVVLATAAILSGDGIEVSAVVLRFDLSVMAWIALLCWPMFLSHGVLSRSEGLVMLAIYAGYTALLVADSAKVPDAKLWKDIFCFAVLPGSLVWFSFVSWRLRNRSASITDGSA